MIPLFNTKDVREVDNYAINKLRIPGIVLMENAAVNITRILLEHYKKESLKKIAVLCGKGNNGGDGFAVARQLCENGINTCVLSISDEKNMSDDCKTNYVIIKNLAKENPSIEFFHLKEIDKFYNRVKNCNLIIDALLGSGASGALKEPILSIVKKINIINVPKAAIDIPTGLDCDKGWGEHIVNCDLTITLAGYKKGLFFNAGYLNSGMVELADIGIGVSLLNNVNTNTFEIEPEDALEGIPEKKKNVHKYSSGKALCICGSGKYPGAGALVSKAAIKIGAGASILAFPESARELVYKDIAEVVVEQYNDDGKDYFTPAALDKLNNRIEWADAVAVGSGLGREPETAEAIYKLLKEKKYKKLVIDADAIFPLNNNIYRKFVLKNVVFTPHIKEFSELINVSIDEISKNILAYGMKFCRETGAYLVLKGAPTILFTPEGNCCINSTGNPGMAKFGTGDVLTGTLVGLISQNEIIEKALISGIYIHSLSADILKVKFSENTFTSIDLIDNFGFTLNFIRKSFAQVY
jgi:NAD(P)H-hydrate epimerase